MKFLHVAALFTAVSAQFYAIPGPTGGVHPRLEIRDLEQTGEMWNLFLLALEEFENMDQTEIDSYYQIAGIHGMPWIDWDGVPFDSVDGRPPERGYCPHGQLLFATWHRPYLTLFEQKLQSVATDIAGRFTGDARARYLDAASKLRLPYWDWARATPTNAAILPSAVTVATVQVTRPNNQAAEMHNPLFDFEFHPKDRSINATGCDSRQFFLGSGTMCNDATRTVRGTSGPSYNTTDHAPVERRFRQLLRNFRTDIVRSFSVDQPFDSFSNTGSCGAVEGRASIESPHNDVHAAFTGHMTPPAVAAFDPIFWLHHANVDRQIAIWQAINPSSYVEPCTSDSTTWTIKPGDALDADSPLTPFHKTASGDFWTSADAREVTDLGYTYPELVGNPSREELIAFINSEYGGPADVIPSKMKRQVSNSTLDEIYLADVHIANVERLYSVSLFLGDVEGNAADWADHESFVGTVTTLGTPTTQKTTVRSIDVTYKLEEKIIAGETTPDNAAEYLKKNLKWRISQVDEEVPRNEIPGLEVSLVSTVVEKATSQSEFDTWIGDFTQHGEIDV